MRKYQSKLNFLDVCSALFKKGTPWSVRALLLLGLLYLIIPTDLLPDVFGLVSYLDDALVLTTIVQISKHLLEKKSAGQLMT